MIEWKAPEFIQHQRNTNWYSLLLIIAGVLSILAIIFKHWTSLILVLLALVVIWMKSLKEPRQIHFVLDEKGLTMDNKLHPFNDFQSFWILENDEGRQIFFRSKKNLSPLLEIPLVGLDKNLVRNFLLKHLPEKEEEESLMAILARILKI